MSKRYVVVAIDCDDTREDLESFDFLDQAEVHAEDIWCEFERTLVEDRQQNLVMWDSDNQ